MYKIGDFSRISGLSVDTLFQYQKNGILKANLIDKISRERFYDANQLLEVNKILGLQEANFSIIEIRDILKYKSHHALMNLLEEKLKFLERLIIEEENRANRLRKHIFFIKNGGMPLINEILIKKTEQILITSIKKSIQKVKTDTIIEDLLCELNTHLMRMNIKPQCPLIILYDQYYLNSDQTTFDVEIATTIMDETEGNEQISIYKLPSEKVVSIVHHGPYHTLESTYQLIKEWIIENKCTVNGSIREIYHYGKWFTEDSDEFLTELQIPIK